MLEELKDYNTIKKIDEVMEYTGVNVTYFLFSSVKYEETFHKFQELFLYLHENKLHKKCKYLLKDVIINARLGDENLVDTKQILCKLFEISLKYGWDFTWGITSLYERLGERNANFR